MSMSVCVVPFIALIFSSLLQDVEEITEDGAPSGRKDFMIWVPPLVDAQDPSLGHKSALTEAVHLARFLMECGIRLIVFCTVGRLCRLSLTFS